MAHVTDASVARQATFDTDPDRAKIKRGTLKLPVIQSEDTHTLVEHTVSKTNDKKPFESKGKHTDTTNKPLVHVKREKDVGKVKDASANERYNAGVNNVKTETKDKQSNEKQKRLNALNQAHKASGSTAKESEQVLKEENNKASVLKDLNSKRSKSPEKKVVHQKTPGKSEKEVENKSVQNKGHSDHQRVAESVTKTNKSPVKRDAVPKKEIVKENDNKNNSDKKPVVDNVVDSKDIKTTSHTVSTSSPQKRPVKSKSPDNHKPKEQSRKDGSNKVDDSKPKELKRTERHNSPEKRTRSPPDSKDRTSEAAVLKSHKSIHHLVPTNSATSSTGTKKVEETPVPQRGRSPEKKKVNFKREAKEQQTKDEKETALNEEKVSTDKSSVVTDENKPKKAQVIVKSISPTPKISPIPSNSAPAETKLISSSAEQKHVKRPNSNKSEELCKAKGDNSSSEKIAQTHKIPKEDLSEKENEIGLTTAFALLVAEGSNHVNEDSDDKQTKESVKVSSETFNDASNETIIENEQLDIVLDLKDKGIGRESKTEHPENTKNSARQTYVISPSPTKFDKSKEAKSPRVNASELKVEPIEIEAKPKGPKMQGKESYEQVYAERNTLLKAEYTFRKRIKQLEDEANGFLKTIEDMTSENRILRDRVDDLENELRQNGKGGGYQRISELENEKADLESKIKKLEHLASSSSKDKEDTEPMQKEIRELKAQVIKLQSENQTLNEENVKIKSENYENIKKLHASEAEAKSLATSVTAVESEKMDKIQDLKNEHAHFKKDNAALKKKNEELSKRVDALEFENASLSENLSVKKNELSEIMTVMKDENKFDNEIKDLKNQVMKLQKEKKDIETTHIRELRIATEALEELKSKYENSLKELDELKIKSDETEKECKSLKKETSSLTKVKMSQEAEIESLKAEIEKLKRALKESTEKYVAMMNETKSNSSDLRNAKETAEELNRDLQKIVEDKENQISRLVAQLDAAKKEKEMDSQNLLSEKERLQNENERLKKVEASLGRVESEFKHVSSKLEEADLKKKQLSIQLQDKGFEVSNLEQQVFELNMKLDSSARRIGQLDKEKRDLEEDRKEWDVKKDKVGDIEASNKRLTEENRRLRSQLEITSYSSDYKTSDYDNNKHVVEAWVSDNSSKSSQQATYVQKEKKKVQIVPHPSNFKKRAAFSKSSPVKSSSKPSAYKTAEPSNKNSLRSSRSLEDLRRSPRGKTPESEPSLPELQKETRLTTYGGMGTLGYSQIHRNRIKTMTKRVY